MGRHLDRGEDLRIGRATRRAIPPSQAERTADDGREWQMMAATPGRESRALRLLYSAGASALRANLGQRACSTWARRGLPSAEGRSIR